MKEFSRVVFVCVSVVLLGVSSPAFAGDKAANGASGHGLMKGGSCPERLAAKQKTFKAAGCESDPDDEDCKAFAKVIEELSCDCGDPKPAAEICKKYE